MTQHSKLGVALWEADRHASALADAVNEWRARTPVVPAQVEADRLLVRLVDQILFRFSKLQDCVGERLVPATLQYLAEPCEEWPMRDRLNRLEKLGFLDVDRWLRWRDLRNRLSHEYPDQPELRFANLLAVIAAADELIASFRDWQGKLPTVPFSN